MTDPRLARALTEDRRYLLNVAFRVLGSVSEAEDAVQEASARLVQQDLDAIDDVRAWLTAVVSRICVDRLRSADRQRRSPADLDAVDPPAGDPDPADRITLDEQVRLALHVVMTQLTPAERIAFVLHDVFSLSFDAVADILGKSPAACRQLASRARRTINPSEDDGALARSAEAHRVAEQFITACSTGDLEGMVALMHPDCVGFGDAGVAVGEVVDLPAYGRRRHGPPQVGPEAIARMALHFNGPGSSITLLSVPGVGPPAVIGLHEGRVSIFVRVTVEDGLITRADVVVDPARLAELDLVLGTASSDPEVP